MFEQINLPFHKKASYLPEEFIVCSANIEAHSLLTNWPKEWGVLPFKASVILYGPLSSGKTHLARIWQQHANAYEITNYTPSISEETLDNYNSFILEDIDKGDEEQILHIFNILHEKKKNLLLTASKNNFSLRDLSSRINSLRQASILQPDDELFRVLLFKNFSRKSINISNNVIDYLAARLPRRFDAVINIVEKIDVYALAHNRKITIPLLKEILATYHTHIV